MAIDTSINAQAMTHLAKGIGSAEIRGKDGGDGSVSLYTHGSLKISFNRNPELRAEKQAAGHQACKDYVSNNFSQAIADRLFPNTDGPITGDQFREKLIQAKAEELLNRNDILNFETCPEPIKNALRSHLTAAYVSENFEFLEKCNEMRQSGLFNAEAQLGPARAAASEIVDNFITFIDPDPLTGLSNSQVNLQSTTKNAVMDADKYLSSSLAAEGADVGALARQSENSVVLASHLQALVAKFDSLEEPIPSVLSKLTELADTEPDERDVSWRDNVAKFADPLTNYDAQLSTAERVVKALVRTNNLTSFIAGQASTDAARQAVIESLDQELADAIRHNLEQNGLV
jgi:hypothetical protein